MEFNEIIFKKEDEVAHITLNRPQVMNSLSPKTISEIMAVCNEIEEDNSLKIVVIDAKGNAFCAGVDLKFIKELSSSLPKYRVFIQSLFGMYNRIEQLTKPVIGVAQGLALAGGLELLNVCDIVIASEDAQFGDQHANFGQISGTQRLSRIVGVRRAKEIMLTGRWLSATEAERIGLINQVVPSDKLEESVKEMVDRLTKNKSELVARRTKSLVNNGIQVSLSVGLELEAQVTSYHFVNSYDAKEGLKAFEERRKPVFKGI
jgi:enoyl-CoA hydratase